MDIIQADWTNHQLLEYAKSKTAFKLIETYIKEQKINGYQFLQMDQKQIDSLLTSNMTAKSAIEKIIHRSKSDESNMEKLNNGQTEDELKLDKNLNSKKNELNAFVDEAVPQEEFEEFLSGMSDTVQNKKGQQNLGMGMNNVEDMNEIEFYEEMSYRYPTNIDNDDQREKMNRFFHDEYVKYKNERRNNRQQPPMDQNNFYYPPNNTYSMFMNDQYTYTNAQCMGPVMPEMAMQITDTYVEPNDLANSLSNASLSNNNHHQNNNNNNNNIPYRE
ncbi:hypothetical protein SNEBB_002297 [Seison nebaliae]|nr:hypothetical protein SNEBB_002297 [Seison nebaliae]